MKNFSRWKSGGFVNFKHFFPISIITFCLLSFNQSPVAAAISPPLVYHVVEEQPKGTLIADDVIAVVALRHGYSDDVTRMLSLTVVDGWMDTVVVSSVGRGALVTAGRLDREVLCPVPSMEVEDACMIWVDLAVYPGQFFEVSYSVYIKLRIIY